MQQIPMTFQNGLRLPAVRPCYWVGFRISLGREGAIFRDEIENYFSCSHLARRDRDYIHDHSRISRRERDSILLLSCFETRSRLQKIVSRGRARKNETDSRREFPGSRILADLWLDHINEFIELIRRVGQRIRSWGVVTIFGETPNMYLHIT